MMSPATGILKACIGTIVSDAIVSDGLPSAWACIALQRCSY
jgi:hypothetical protein